MKFVTTVAQVLTVGVLITLAGAAAAQQAYPGRPIRFIVGNPPGGQTSILARLVGQKLTESWGQQVIVDNRPGANGLIGAEALVKSPPDGYTILLITNSHAVIPHLHRSLPFDSIRDFAPVATISANETLLVLHPSVAANNLQELIALAKSKPGQLNYAMLGIGGVNHLASELFKLAAGIKIQAIPYKGAGPAVAALVGGEVQLSIQGPATSIPHIKSGRLRALAITGAARWSALPQVPTFAESGLPDYDIKYWQAVLAPAGTPKAVIDKLSTEIGRILAMPDTNERLVSQGLDPFISTSGEFAALLKAEMAKYGKIIKAANIKIES